VDVIASEKLKCIWEANDSILPTTFKHLLFSNR